MSVSLEHDAADVAWETKPVLRTVYTDLLQRVVAELVDGVVLELGGGASRLKDFRAGVIASDLLYSHRVDLVADAQRLPIRDAAVENIVLFDVLHHIPRPMAFLREAERVLKPGGRLVMMEPAITPGSWLFYRFFHPEPFDMSVDPLGDDALSSDKPYDSNQAIPTLLAIQFRDRLAEACPGLRFASTRWLSLFAYPLSGGLRPWSLVSAGMARGLLAIESSLPQWIARRLAFRVLLVLERRLPRESPAGA